MTNGVRLPIRQTHIEIFSRRVLRKLRRILLPGSDSWWSLRATPSSLANAEKIYRLLDSGSDMFLDLDCEDEAVTENDEELVTIRTQLARISSAIHRATGVKAAKLDTMINRALSDAYAEHR